jgi:PAS domain S-box-containing protein
MPDLVSVVRARNYRRFGFAFATVVAALLIRQAVVRFLGLELPPFITFYLSILIVAILAGLWPGLVATVFASLLTHYWILREHGHSANAGGSDAIAQAIFFATGVFVSVLAERYRSYLRQNELRYRFMFENMAEGLAYCKILLDDAGHAKDFVYLEVNRAFVTITGLENVTDKRVSQVVPGILEANRELIETYGRVALTGKPERFEVDVDLLGKSFSVLAYCPKHGHFVAVFEDITERNRAKKKIVHLASFPQLNPCLIFETDLEGNITYSNPALARTFPAIRKAGAEHPLMKDWPAVIASLKANVGHPIVREVATDGLTLLQTVSYASEFEVVRAYCVDISDRKQTEEALRNSEEMFRQFAENVDAVIWMLPASANQTLYVSPSYEHIWGRSCASIYQNPMSWLEAVHPDDQAPIQSRLASLMAGESIDSEYRIRTPDNKEKWIQNRIFPIRDQNGQMIWFGGISTDITERKRLESEMLSAIRALETSEGYYRAIFEQAAVGMIQTSFEGHFLKCNKRFAEIVGYSVEEIPGLTFQQITAPDDLASSTMVLQQMVSGDIEPTTWDKRYIRKDGTLTWVKITVSIQRDGEGRALHLIAMVEDINAHKTAEESLVTTTKVLQVSEKRFQKLLEHSPNAVMVERKNVIEVANRAAVELFGLSSPKDLIGRRLADIVGSEARIQTEELVHRLHESEVQLPLEEMCICRKDGLQLAVDIVASSIKEDEDTVALLVVRNITERKQAEAKHAQLIQSIEQVAESIIVTDLEGAILYVNPAFEKITGYTRKEAIGSNPRIIKSGRHPASFYQAMWATLLRGETWSGELVNKRKNGTLFSEVATISPIKDQSGTVINYVAVKRDITQEQLLRDQLSHAQKMESLGRIAGGIAHDFNNLLMVIQTYVEVLQDPLPLQDSLRESTKQILEAVERGASLTGQLLAFSRKQISSPVVIDLNAVIDETTKMLRRVIGEDIELRVALSNALWAIKADPDQIIQVLMNLCINARDAMPRGGRLKIATENVTVKPRSAVGQHYVVPGHYVMLSVTDSGEGISKKIQKDIFEPFFTTKEIGKGTGLGLAMVYGIVKQNGGYVWVDSKLKHGARFTIYLPKVAQTAVPVVSIQAKATPKGTETILVVEDEKSLRRGISDLLNGLGYTVLAASSGAEALAIACKQEHIDLLLTDVIMPKMGGRELAELLRNLQPNLKIIYMSGYTDDVVLRNGIHDQNTDFLQKPFGLSALANKVREALGQVDPKHET